MDAQLPLTSNNAIEHSQSSTPAVADSVIEMQGDPQISRTLSIRLLGSSSFG